MPCLLLTLSLFLTQRNVLFTITTDEKLWPWSSDVTNEGVPAHATTKLLSDTNCF